LVGLTAAALALAADVPFATSAMSARRDALPAVLSTNVVFGAIAVGIGGLSIPGALAGVASGVVLTSAFGWGGWLLLAATFGIAVGTTRVGHTRKAGLGIAEERGGRRSATQVVANTGIAAAAAALSVVSPIGTAGAIAAAAALATTAGDTAASEIGKAWMGRTWSLPLFRPVPAGTTGAVSAAGTAAGVVAAVILAGVARAGGLLPSDSHMLVVASAATTALVAEGLIAVVCETNGWLDNDGVNYLGSALGAGLALMGAAFIG
jgi:uncharacterized protein (TIGR00297 family)